jgi:hypothetical protein
VTVIDFKSEAFKDDLARYDFDAEGYAAAFNRAREQRQ